MENKLTLEMILLVCQINTKLLRLVAATFDSKVASLKRMRKKNLIILKSLLMAMLEEYETQRSLWKMGSKICLILIKSITTFHNIRTAHRHFGMHFRMNLSALLTNLRKDDTSWRESIELEKRAAIALFTLSLSNEYRVCTILTEFCGDMWQVLSRSYIKKLPPTQEVFNKCIDEFQRLGFPQCRGAIGKFKIFVILIHK